MLLARKVVPIVFFLLDLLLLEWWWRMSPAVTVTKLQNDSSPKPKQLLPPLFLLCREECVKNAVASLSVQSRISLPMVFFFLLLIVVIFHHHRAVTKLQNSVVQQPQQLSVLLFLLCREECVKSSVAVLV